MAEFAYSVMDIVQKEQFPVLAFFALLLFMILRVYTPGMLSKIIGLFLIAGALATVIAVSLLHRDFWLIALFAFLVMILAFVMQNEKDPARTHSLHGAAKHARQK